MREVAVQPETKRETIRQGIRENRRLTRSHYENFSVGSILLPKSIRYDLSNIYAFCRLADDIADEAAGGVSRSDRLTEWRRNLNQCATGDVKLPLFAALGETIRKRSLELAPFHDLINAFEQDLTTNRYETWDDLFAYCRLSANPVGRIVLAVCGCANPQYFAYSDKICTALQLANHWQDVREDFFRGRIYIPQESMLKFAIEPKIINDGVPTANFRRMMHHLCDTAEDLFHEGKPLISKVGKPLAPQLYIYYHGGLAALEAIRRHNGDVLTANRRVGFTDRLRLISGAALLWIRGTF